MSFLMRVCGACGAPVGRRTWSDYWRCDNGHTIYRVSYEKPPRYEVRPTDSDEWNRAEDGGTHDVWDLLADEPFYDRTADEYMFGVSHARALSVCDRLNQ